MTYKGPPEFSNIPLTGRDARNGISVGQRDVPFVKELGVRGTEGLGPFPSTPPCPPEEVPQRTFPTPNNPLLVERGLQIFSQWGGLVDGEVDPATPFFSAYTFLRSPIPEAKGELGEDIEGVDTVSKLWMIDVWGYEVARVVPENGPALPPLNSARIIDNSIERGNGGNQFSRLKMRLNTHSASGGATRIFDIAEGIRLAIEAWQVQVEVLFPENGTVEVKGNPNLQLGGGGGLVLDSVVGGFITEVCSTPGLQSTTNTITMRVPLGVADLPVLVPPGARLVDVYQTSVGTPAIMDWRLLRGPVIGPSLGQITLGGDRRVTALIRPGNAGMITTGGADPINDRILTFVFRGEI